MDGTRSPVLARLQGAVGWLALAAVLLAALPRGANIPVAWLGLALVAGALLAVQLVLDLADRAAPARLARLVLPGLLAVAVLAWGLAQTMWSLPQAAAAAASALGLPPPAGLIHPAWDSVDVPGTISADPIEGRQSAVRIAVYLALFWIAVRAGGAGARAERMVRTVAVALAALAAYGLAAAAGGDNPLLGEASAQVTASFVNRNSFATYASFGVVASLSVLLVRATAPGAGGRGRGRALRGFLEGFLSGGWLYMLTFVVAATALAASQSRGGALAAGCGVVLVLAAHRSNGGHGAGGPALWAVLAGAAFVTLTSASGLLGRVVAPSEELRFTIYGAIVDAIAARPLAGHGLGAFQDAFRAYVPAEAGAAGEWDLAHNTYLELAFELGLPAAGAFFLALLLVVGRIARGTLARRSNLAVPLTGLGCAVAAGVHSAFDFSLQIPAIAALFSMLLGLAWAQSFSRGER